MLRPGGIKSSYRNFFFAWESFVSGGATRYARGGQTASGKESLNQIIKTSLKLQYSNKYRVILKKGHKSKKL